MKELIRLVASALWLEGSSWSESSVVGHLALSVVPEPLHASCPISADWLIDHSSTICHPSTQHHPRSGFYFCSHVFLLSSFYFFRHFLLFFYLCCVFVQTQTCKLFSTAKYRFYKFTRIFVMPTLFYSRIQAKCKTAVIGSWRDFFDRSSVTSHN